MGVPFRRKRAAGPEVAALAYLLTVVLLFSGLIVAQTGNPVPTLSSISPTSAAAGSSTFTLRVTGTGFNLASKVRWNGQDQSTTYVGATQLSAVIWSTDIATAGTAQVTVYNPPTGGGTSNAIAFTIVANPVPTITSISPSTAAAGSGTMSVTVTGTGFTAASKVRWNGTDASTTYTSSTKLSAIIWSDSLATAGTAEVTVYNPGAGSSNAVTFTIAANPVPTITSISPASAAAGAGTLSVTVTGTGFTAGSKVRWNGTDVSTTYSSSTQLSAIIWSDSLATAGTAQMTVYNPGAGSSNAVTFTITANPVPTITSISPASAAAGSGSLSVTVTGTGFTAASKVRWNGSDSTISTSYNSSTQLWASISSSLLAAAGTAEITVYNPGAGSSSPVTFTVSANPTPTVTSISPDSAYCGSPTFSLNVSGTGFTAASKVRWNGKDEYTTYGSSTKISATIWDSDIPPAAGTVPVLVFNTGANPSNAVDFKVLANPAPAITSISPSSMPPGASSFSLTVNGSGFTPASVVRWNGVGKSTSYSSSTQLRATIWSADITAAGLVQVTVYNPPTAGGSSNAITFMISGAGNPVPSITSISPTSVAAGSGAFTLTVNGSNFISSSVVRWNGSDRATAFLSATQLTAAILASDTASLGTVQVTVFNPPEGGGSSAPQTFTVASGCTYSLSASGASHGPGAENGTVTVTAPAGCTWTASSNDGWITVVSGSAGTGAGTVNYSVPANPSPSERGGTLTIAGRTFTLSQAAGVSCKYTISPESQSFSESGGTDSVSVSTQSGCAWSVVRNASFITVTSGGSGSGSGTVAYLVLANDFRNPRTGTLTIAGQTFTVSQTGASGTAVTFSVSPTLLGFSAPAGSTAVPSQEITVSSPVSGLAWTAGATSQGGTWLSISPAAGTAPGVVSASVNLAGLSPGSYRGSIQVQSAGAVPPARTISVDLTVGAALPAQLVTEPTSIAFETQPGAGNPRPKTLRISNAGDGSLNWSARAETSNGGSWLILAPTSGTVSGSSPEYVQVIANASSLGPGIYTGAIHLTAQQAQTVPVTLRVTPAAQTILLSQTALVFTGVQGSALVPSQSFGIVNTGDGRMNWKVQAGTFSGGNWLTVASGSGSSEASSLSVPEVEVGINLAGLRAGQYSGLIRVEAPDADNSPQFVVVDLLVLPPGSDPGVQVRPTGLIFATRPGGSTPAPQSVRLATAKPGRMEIVSGVLTSDSVNWLEVQPRSSTVDAPGATLMNVQTSLGSLAPGVRRGAVTFLLSDGGSQTVNILYLVVGAANPLSAAYSPLGGGVHAADCYATRLLGVHRSLSSTSSTLTTWTGTIEVRVVDDCGNPVPDANVVANFNNGDRPLSLASLRNGVYTATWRPISPASRVAVTVRANKPPLAEAQLSPVQVDVPSSAGVPALFEGGVVNAASFAPREPLAPGSIVSLFGRNLAYDQNYASRLPLDTKLGGATLLIGGQEAPLFFTSSGQINAQLPSDLAPNGRPQAVVRTSKGGAGAEFLTLPEPITIAPVKPGIFTVGQDGKGQGVIMDVANRLVNSANPAKAGDVVVVYCTGLGATNPAVRSGEAAPASPLARVLTPVTVTIGGQAAAVQYAGLTPGYVGLYQVNVQIPGGVTPGSSVPLVLSQNGVPSNAVTLAVR